ncbi:hypothetical protein B0H16DRAFT_1471713 [Mycena metata]|uniref:Uncharacterized protein n=1 Tax=Mycena metata TaxID=1033252 RepID=A0AAD7HRB5_9AGAR|nr:hypothetical protein B0H16DRAFT_1471713 [Mycena metata]
MAVTDLMSCGDTLPEEKTGEGRLWVLKESNPRRALAQVNPGVRETLNWPEIPDVCKDCWVWQKCGMGLEGLEPPARTLSQGDHSIGGARCPAAPFLLCFNPPSYYWVRTRRRYFFNLNGDCLYSNTLNQAEKPDVDLEGISDGTVLPGAKKKKRNRFRVYGSLGNRTLPRTRTFETCVWMNSIAPALKGKNGEEHNGTWVLRESNPGAHSHYRTYI